MGDLDNTRKGKTLRILVEEEFDPEAFKARKVRRGSAYTPDRNAYLVLLLAYDQYMEHCKRLAARGVDNKEFNRLYDGVDFDRVIADATERGWLGNPQVPLQPERVAAAVIYWVSKGYLMRRPDKKKKAAFSFDDSGLRLCEALARTREYLTLSVVSITGGKKDGNNYRWAPLVLVGRLLDGTPRYREDLPDATGLLPKQIKRAEGVLKKGFTVLDHEGDEVFFQGELRKSVKNPSKLVLSPGVIQRGDVDLDEIPGSAEEEKADLDEKIKDIEAVTNQVLGTDNGGNGKDPDPTTFDETVRSELKKVGGDPVSPPPSPKIGIDPDELTEFLDDVAKAPAPSFAAPAPVSRVRPSGLVEVVATIKAEDYASVSKYLRDEGLGTIEESFAEHLDKLTEEARQYHDEADARARYELLIAESEAQRAAAEKLKSEYGF